MVLDCSWSELEFRRGIYDISMTGTKLANHWTQKFYGIIGDSGRMNAFSVMFLRNSNVPYRNSIFLIIFLNIRIYAPICSVNTFITHNYGLPNARLLSEAAAPVLS